MQMKTKEIWRVVLNGIPSKLKKLKRSSKKRYPKKPPKKRNPRKSLKRKSQKNRKKESPEDPKVVINGASNRISEES